MTKENRERQYKHFRNMEKNYEPKDPSLNSGPTSISTVRKRAKESADAMLKKHPELEAPIEEPIEEEPVEEEEKHKSKRKK